MPKLTDTEFQVKDIIIKGKSIKQLIIKGIENFCITNEDLSTNTFEYKLVNWDKDKAIIDALPKTEEVIE